MRNFETDRERAASDLAERPFSSWRSKATASAMPQVGDHARRDNLTLDEVEHVLERWKLEGRHGG